MNLLDLINREPVPEPWSEGYKIPWDETGFSERMLREHLTQDHDAASRRFERIDLQVAWINDTLLCDGPARILDLTCGPGLYSSRLAALGHTCHGIDFGPASIAYAREQAEAQDLACEYELADLRTAAFGEGYDLAMLIYGEFNVFQPEDIQSILQRAWAALKPGGRLLLEPQTDDCVRQAGTAPSTWRTVRSGLWSDRPYLYLEDPHWDEKAAIATTRYYVIDAETGDVSRYAQSMIAYSPDEFRELLAACGFVDIVLRPGLTDDASYDEPWMLAITARKPNE